MKFILIAVLAALAAAATASQQARPTPHLDMDALRQKQQELFEAFDITPEKMEELNEAFQSLFPGVKDKLNDILGQREEF